MKFNTLFTSLCLAVLVSGCAAPKAIDIKSGFLSDYSKLKASKTDENAAVYFAEGYDPKNYKTITFAPVVVNLSEKLAKDSNLGQEQQEQIAKYVTEQLDKALSEGFIGMGEGTLNIRASVSGLSDNSEELSLYQYLPITLAAAAAMEATGQRDKNLVIFLEAEAIDEATEEVVAAKVVASDLGLIDSGDLEDNPIEAIKPLLDKWIGKLVSNINKQLQ